MIISLDVEKAFDKIQHYIMLKCLGKIRKSCQVLPKHNKTNVEQNNSQHKLNGETLETIPQKSGIKQGCPLTPYLQYSTRNSS